MIAQIAAFVAAASAITNIIVTVRLARAGRDHAEKLAEVTHESSYLLTYATRRAEAYVETLKFVIENGLTTDRVFRLLRNGGANAEVPVPGDAISQTWTLLRAYASDEIFAAYSRWNSHMIEFCDVGKKLKTIRQAQSGHSQIPELQERLDAAKNGLTRSSQGLCALIKDELRGGLPLGVAR
jgi:hypothetical protein